MSARDEILARVRAATADVTTPVGARGATPVVEETSPGPGRTLDLFAENVADYRAEVLRVPADEVASVLASTLRGRGLGSVVVLRHRLARGRRLRAGRRAVGGHGLGRCGAALSHH